LGNISQEKQMSTVRMKPEPSPIANPHSIEIHTTVTRTWETKLRVVGHLFCALLVFALGAYIVFAVLGNSDFHWQPFNLGTFMVMAFGGGCFLLGVATLFDAWRIWKRGDE
jgi:hypothetical protein